MVSRKIIAVKTPMTLDRRPNRNFTDTAKEVEDLTEGGAVAATASKIGVGIAETIGTDEIAEEEVEANATTETLVTNNNKRVKTVDSKKIDPILTTRK